MARRTTAEAVAQAAIARIVAREPDVHAWEVFAPELALAQARRVDAALAAGGAASGAGLLAGVPIAVKDILDTADLPTAYGSPIYRGAQPAADA
ncbi:MAG: amidase, partial [Gammaproteobacteria bacterium]|nr:amidase [Gammaproteobacteria bacterium]